MMSRQTTTTFNTTRCRKIDLSPRTRRLLVLPVAVVLLILLLLETGNVSAAASFTYSSRSSSSTTRKTTTSLFLSMRSSRRTSLVPLFAINRHNDPHEDVTDNNNDNNLLPSMRKRKQELIDFIEEPMDSLVGDISTTSSTTDDLRSLVDCIVKAADDRKSTDIVAYYVGQVSTLTQYMVICSGNSRPQTQAIAKSILEAVRVASETTTSSSSTTDTDTTITNEQQQIIIQPEGTAESGWMVLDYGSVMVHIMSPKSRLFYNVEGQWKEKGAKPVDLSHVLLPPPAFQMVKDEDESSSPTFPSKEEDPFWS